LLKVWQYYHYYYFKTKDEHKEQTTQNNFKIGICMHLQNIHGKGNGTPKREWNSKA